VPKINDIVVLINTYHEDRRPDIERIMEAWLEQTRPVSVCIINGGEEPLAGCFREEYIPEDVHIIEMDPDLGSLTDYAIATLLGGQFLIFADDDFLPKPGFVDTIAQHLYSKRTMPGFVGVMGRAFDESGDYEKSTYYRADRLGVPLQKVDFVGVCFATTYEMLCRTFPFDPARVHRNCDDIWLQMLRHPNLPKHVFATDQYVDLPCASDGSAMYRDPSLRGARQAMVSEWFFNHKQKSIRAEVKTP